MWKRILDWLGGVAGGWKTTTPPPPPAPPAGNDLLSLHNAERQRRGVPPLSADPRLTAAATLHARWMAEHLLYRHDGEGGSRPEDRARAAGYAGRAVAENVALSLSPDAAGAWLTWQNSPKHLANATDPAFRDAGFDSALGRDGLTYWCAVYGREQ